MDDVYIPPRGMRCLDRLFIFWDWATTSIPEKEKRAIDGVQKYRTEWVEQRKQKASLDRQRTLLVEAIIQSQSSTTAAYATLSEDTRIIEITEIDRQRELVDIKITNLHKALNRETTALDELRKAQINADYRFLGQDQSSGEEGALDVDEAHKKVQQEISLLVSERRKKDKEDQEYRNAIQDNLRLERAAQAAKARAQQQLSESSSSMMMEEGAALGLAPLTPQQQHEQSSEEDHGSRSVMESLSNQ